MISNCPADEQLLAIAADEPVADEIQKHLDDCPDCKQRLTRLRDEIGELRSFSNTLIGGIMSSGTASVTEPTLANSTKVGRYVVVGSLGSGGQADVYRVIDPNLERQLVLKLSRHKSNADDERNAVLEEGRLLADLDHPGIIRVFDVGLFNERPYLVLEHVPGRNLEQTYASKSPSPDEAARLISEVANTVAFVHRRGIVHGDITPRNILIDVDGHARLIDFGLSKFEDAWSEKRGLAGGTPEFLPPEAVPIDGRARRAGPAGDVFGLGATLYWLLTGQPPFIGKTIVETLEMARRCEIEFAAFRRAHVPSRIEKICQQALAADPSARPAPQLLAESLQRASRRRLSMQSLYIAGALAMGIGGIFLGQFMFNDPPLDENVNVIHSTPTVSIFRRDGRRTLSNELPLRDGDRLAVWCNISRKQDAVVLWFNAVGELRIVTPMRDVVGKMDRLIYPGPRRSFPLQPPQGTEMFFFCRGDQIDEADLKTCFPIGTVTPRLPDLNWLTLQRSEVKVEGPLDAEIPVEIVQIEGTMKEIDRQLRRHFQGVTGVAFPHRPASESTE